jgi:hypothetical protein
MIDEAMTMLTDYVLAGVAGWFGWRLFHARDGQSVRAFWVLTFAALAAAALLGGTYHGFLTALGEDRAERLWLLTVLATGLVSFGMVAGAATALTTGFLRRLLLVAAVGKLAVFAWWMLAHDDFLFVILDSGIALVLVAALHGWGAAVGRDPASGWMLGGVVVSLRGAGVQASGFELHEDFNHNDLYHVVQTIAIALFYTGARQLRDRVAVSA